MISQTHKFIFIHIPGTGGTSIEFGLKNYQSGELCGVGGGIWEPEKSIKEKIESIHGKSICLNAKHMTALQWKEVLGDEYDNYYKFTIVRHPLDKAMSLFKFNNQKPLQQPDWIIEQALFVTDNDGNIIIDDVYKFEDLQNSWKSICKKLNITHESLPHKNNRNPKKETINSIIDEKEINELKLMTELDFKLFNYK
jgi:hypothetical protein